MTSVSLSEATKRLPALLERAQTESVFLRDEQGTEFMILSFRPRSDREREQAWLRAETLSDQASRMLEESLVKDGITLEAFLDEALHGE